MGRQFEAVITRALETTPRDATHWLDPVAGRRVGAIAVGGLPDLAGLRAPATPARGLEAGQGPQSIDKVRDVVGLYLDPARGGGGAVRGRTDHQETATRHTPLVQALNADIRDWIKTSNDNPRPYVWNKTADQILDGIARYCDTN